MENKKSFDNEEIDLKELFSILWKGKYKIIIAFILASIISVTYALSLPNIYKSSALLAPASNDDNSMSMLQNGQIGGLANIAGISLPSNSDSKTNIGIEVMKSRQFFSIFGLTEEFLVPLLASTGWDRSTNTLIIDEKIYNLKQKKWVRDAIPPRSSIPSLQEAHRQFMSLFSISSDIKTGHITVSIEHFSPNVAQKWLELVIVEINNSIRYKEIANAELSIGYLNDEISTTQNTQLLLGLNQMIQSHTETKVLARATQEYVFQIIDPPYAPELKNSPRRSVICIIGAIIGILIGVLIVLINHYFISPKRAANL